MVGKPLAFVVDDEAQWRTLVSTALSAAAFEVQAFKTHDEVVVALAARKPRIIILDLSLGDSDAVEVIHSLALAQYAGSLMLMSGHDPGTVGEVHKIAERHGLSLLPSLQKPFRIAELKERIASVLATEPVPPSAVSLEAALDNNWLEVWYQPKIELTSGQIGGAEALIRMRHPEKGILSPGEFLPPPGDPLYFPLTEFIGRRAMSDWPDFAKLGMKRRLAINVPASVLQKPDFVAAIRRHFPKTSDFPGLIAEITEDEAISNLQAARDTAVQLRLYNVHVSIDDFGSAFSTIERLTELPFAEVKLDRSFVDGCSRDERKLAMCRAVVELSRKFEITTVAEGLETREDLKTIVELGFDMAQGFLYAKPMPAQEFMNFIRLRLRR